MLLLPRSNILQLHITLTKKELRYITLLLSKVIILCNLVTKYVRFTNEHVRRTLFLLRKQDFYV